MNEKQIIEKVWNWYKDNDCFDGKSDWYVFQKVGNFIIKLCSEAYGKDVVELTNEAEYWKKKRDLEAEAHKKEIEIIQKSHQKEIIQNARVHKKEIDTLQRKIDEGTRELKRGLDDEIKLHKAHIVMANEERKQRKAISTKLRDFEQREKQMTEKIDKLIEATENLMRNSGDDVNPEWLVKELKSLKGDKEC